MAVSWEWESGATRLYYDGEEVKPFWSSKGGYIESADPKQGGVDPHLAAQSQRLDTGTPASPLCAAPSCCIMPLSRSPSVPLPFCPFPPSSSASPAPASAVDVFLLLLSWVSVVAPLPSSSLLIPLRA